MMTLHELLAHAHDLPDRTLRHWTQLGLVPPCGPDGHYGDEHLRRLFAIFRLQAEGVRTLREIATRLEAMGPEEEERFAFPADVTEAPPAVAAAVAPVTVASPASTNTVLAEEWTHVTLTEGLLLAIRRPAGDEARALVRSIALMCGTTIDVT
jgi:DNA-binding transcriptional MerR regulator